MSRRLARLLIGLLAVWGWSAPVSSSPFAGEVSSQEVLARALLALGGDPTEGGRIQLAPVFPPAPVRFDGGALAWRTQVLAPLSAESPRVRLDLSGGGALLRTWTVSFRKLALKECWVARRAMTRGERVAPEQFEKTLRPLEPWVVPASAEGTLPPRALRGPLAEGEVLTHRHVLELPVVERGQAVEVTFSSGRLTGTVSAQATQAGYPGRPFRVRTQDRRTLTVWWHPDGAVRTAPLDGAGWTAPNKGHERKQG